MDTEKDSKKFHDLQDDQPMFEEKNPNTQENFESENLSNVSKVNRTMSDDGQKNVNEIFGGPSKSEHSAHRSFCHSGEDDEEIEGDSIALIISDGLYSLNERYMDRLFISAKYLYHFDM